MKVVIMESFTRAWFYSMMGGGVILGLRSFLFNKSKNTFLFITLLLLLLLIFVELGVNCWVLSWSLVSVHPRVFLFLQCNVVRDLFLLKIKCRSTALFQNKCQFLCHFLWKIKEWFIICSNTCNGLGIKRLFLAKNDR